MLQKILNSGILFLSLLLCGIFNSVYLGGGRWEVLKIESVCAFECVSELFW